MFCKGNCRKNSNTREDAIVPKWSDMEFTHAGVVIFHFEHVGFTDVKRMFSVLINLRLHFDTKCNQYW